MKINKTIEFIQGFALHKNIEGTWSFRLYLGKFCQVKNN